MTQKATDDTAILKICPCAALTRYSYTNERGKQSYSTILAFVFRDFCVTLYATPKECFSWDLHFTTQRERQRKHHNNYDNQKCTPHTQFHVFGLARARFELLWIYWIWSLSLSLSVSFVFTYQQLTKSLKIPPAASLKLGIHTRPSPIFVFE